MAPPPPNNQSQTSRAQSAPPERPPQPNLNGLPGMGPFLNTIDIGELLNGALGAWSAEPGVVGEGGEEGEPIIEAAFTLSSVTEDGRVDDAIQIQHDFQFTSLGQALSFMNQWMASGDLGMLFNGVGGPHFQGQPPASVDAVNGLRRIALPYRKKKKDMGVSWMCAVCQEGSGPGEEGKALMMPCSHSFHSTCLTPWLKNSNTCPTCRFEVMTDNAEYNIGVTTRMAARSTSKNGKSEGSTATSASTEATPSGAKSKSGSAVAKEVGKADRVEEEEFAAPERDGKRKALWVESDSVKAIGIMIDGDDMAFVVDENDDGEGFATDLNDGGHVGRPVLVSVKRRRL
ncbi:hypothetical protein HDU97_000373 [Phlyctochytrium planicorne]|nr:hypothetical protein HDU97_000373 [Phlyctochytrium planicorne]